MTVESSPAFIHVDGLTSQAYNEVAFRYFLDIERRRAQRSTRPLLLLLVKAGRSRNPDVSTRIFPKVFAALAGCVREADFVGWYRQDAIAAAVLALSGPVSEAVPQRVKARVVGTLMNTLSSDDFSRISVRAIVVGGSPRI